ncbi:hypothetical protein INT48_005245 [Thamnidium elegans]|uniref:Uncharacterized protein n=1 Tax=Thamnidium elegans TaxID=101142 RepID=A0A8H7SH32_9FUNG|nr:hypothetical protein INT48_005245 [Thamnidium elegans]
MSAANSDTKIDFNIDFALDELFNMAHVDSVSGIEMNNRQRLNERQRQASRARNNNAASKNGVGHSAHDTDDENSEWEDSSVSTSDKRDSEDDDDIVDTVAEVEAEIATDASYASDGSSSDGYSSDTSSYHSDHLEDTPGTFFTSSFKQYVAACLRADTLEKKLDLHFNRLRLKNSIKYPIIIDMTISDHNPLEFDHDITQDFDAFIASNTESIPLKEGVRCALFFAPKSQEKITTLDYGTCLVGEKTKNIKDVPHTLLASVEAYGRLKCYISFPSMCEDDDETEVLSGSDESESDNDDEILPKKSPRKKFFLSAAEQEDFIDRFFLPAIKESVSRYALTNLPGSYKHATSNGFSNMTTDYIDSSHLMYTTQLMRQIATNDPEFSMYKDFFFSCSSFGSKQMFRGNVEDILGSIIDWRILEKRKVFIDIATTLCDSERNSSFFVQDGCHHRVAALHAINLDEKKKFYPHCLSSFGNFSVKSKMASQDGVAIRPSKFIAYNSMKTTFAGKTGPSIFTGFTGKHFSGMGLWRAGDTSTRMTHEWYKNRFEENENRAFPLRFEGRYTADVLNVQFLKKLSDQALAVKQHSCLLEVDTALYMKYLNNRRELLETMSRHFSKKTDAESLSALVLISDRIKKFVFSVSRPIRNRKLRDLALRLGTTASTPCSGLGTPYLGANFFIDAEKNISGLYFEKANNIFVEYGLGVASAARFLEIFFEEYLALVDSKFISPGSRNMSLTFDCFLYDTIDCPFIKTTKNVFNKSDTLVDRFKHLLPLVSSREFGNADIICKKIRCGGTWANFGSRAAYIQLFMNSGLSVKHMTVFRAFFFLAIHMLFEFIPMNSAARMLYVENGVPRLQRTINKSKMNDAAPTAFPPNYVKLIKILNPIRN